jgi:predicted metal-dependent hydrolase
LLQYLAHELAHLEHWDHTPDHKHLECILMSAFMTRLKQDFYVSEEDEMKNGSFY